MYFIQGTMYEPIYVPNFVDFIIARHEIWQARDKGSAKPWTNDPILRDYRFCNVYRELDTVTKWVRNTWANSDDRDNWFAMAVARWVNWPDTLEEIGYPVPWKPKKFISVLNDRKARGEKVWTGAYMIGTQGNAMDKNKFIAEGVLQPLWDARTVLRPRQFDSLHQFYSRVVAIKNQGSFMVGQIIADIKYSDPYLLAAPDWDTWAVSGPGSRRGLNRVINRDTGAGWKEPTFHEVLLDIREIVNMNLLPWMDPLHAQDVQNCLCEFDKYERVRNGEGKPRSRYPGRA